MKQCRKCPWLVGVNPLDIPDGYSLAAHRALESTIAKGADPSKRRFRAMACHESPLGAERPCVGWAHNQLGVGNNIALRIYAMRTGEFRDLQLCGEQHSTFESTLPPMDGDDGC